MLAACRPPARQSLALPAEFVQHAGQGPIVCVLYQPGAHRIFAHIIPSLVVALVLAQAMVEAAHLKVSMLNPMQTLEGPFPKSDPLLDRELLVQWRAEKMQMIGHDDVTPDHPGVGQSPAFHQVSGDDRISQPAAPALRANGEENDGRLSAKNEHSGAGATPSIRHEPKNVFLVAFFGRGENLLVRGNGGGARLRRAGGSATLAGCRHPARRSLALPLAAPEGEWLCGVLASSLAPEARRYLPQLDGVSLYRSQRSTTQLFVAPRAARPLIFRRMFRFRVSPLAALAGLILVFTSCERHHVGELPELQREHLHPLEAAAEEPAQARPASPLASPTPADFFPKPTP